MFAIMLRACHEVARTSLYARCESVLVTIHVSQQCTRVALKELHITHAEHKLLFSCKLDFSWSGYHQCTFLLSHDSECAALTRLSAPTC